MDINTLRGISAYANPINTTPPVDQSMLQKENPEASESELKKQTANAAQKSFEVTITEEARKKMALETKPEPSEVQSPPPDQSAQSVEKAYETSQIVNIVA